MWSVPHTTGEKPPPMARHTFTKVDHRRAVVFGGSLGGGKTNDTYVLDMETWVWRLLGADICTCAYCLSSHNDGMPGNRWPMTS